MIGLVAIGLLLSALYFINFEYGNEVKIYINECGFSNFRIDIFQNTRLIIYNNDTIQHQLTINDREKSQIINPNEKISYKPLGVGQAMLSLDEENCQINQYVQRLNVIIKDKS